MSDFHGKTVIIELVNLLQVFGLKLLKLIPLGHPTGKESTDHKWKPTAPKKACLALCFFYISCLIKTIIFLKYTFQMDVYIPKPFLFAFWVNIFPSPLSYEHTTISPMFHGKEFFFFLKPALSLHAVLPVLAPLDCKSPKHWLHVLSGISLLLFS